MKVEVVPFEEDRCLEDAAALFVREYRRVGAAVRVPQAFMDETHAAEAIMRRIFAGPAVAALSEGRLVGFVGADAGTARIRLAQHQADSSDVRQVYRVLYASLSEQLAGMSYPSHSFDVLVACAEAVAAWFELGFGVDQIKGVRPAGLQGTERAVGARVRRAVELDLSRLVDLCIELEAFHERPPICGHARDDGRAQATRDMQAALSNEDAVVFVAEAGTELVGLIEAERDHLLDETATIYIAVTSDGWRGQGLGSSLLAAVDGWAREKGYAYVAAGWSSANLVSDRFWRGCGFRPYRYTLRRRFRPRDGQSGQTRQ
jgi:GNAT superfamily N-acetyltransferase